MRILAAARDGGLADSMREERTQFQAMVHSFDMREGVSAVIEERPPFFQDK
jgi:enoyl-CoA hydratase/carnithine racemase